MALEDEAGAMKSTDEQNSEIDDDTLKIDLQRAVERATNRLENRALSAAEEGLVEDEIAPGEIDVDALTGFLN